MVAQGFKLADLTFTVDLLSCISVPVLSCANCFSN
uniref:Uncharacterized protein n=1 Tax=Anguilla anguilla TaxID=7936 RepID=A0A0E9SGN7_ANGAN